MVLSLEPAILFGCLPESGGFRPSVSRWLPAVFQSRVEFVHCAPKTLLPPLLWFADDVGIVAHIHSHFLHHCSFASFWKDFSINCPLEIKDSYVLMGTRGWEVLSTIFVQVALNRMLTDHSRCNKEVFVINVQRKKKAIIFIACHLILYYPECLFPWYFLISSATHSHQLPSFQKPRTYSYLLS